MSSTPKQSMKPIKKKTRICPICIPMSDCCNERVNNYRGEYSSFATCQKCGEDTTVHEKPPTTPLPEECKRCGLLRSTILATGKLCVSLSTVNIPAHDFGESTLLPEECKLKKILCWIGWHCFFSFYHPHWKFFKNDGYRDDVQCGWCGYKGMIGRKGNLL